MTDRFAGSRVHRERASRSIAGGVTTAVRATQLPVTICFAGGRGCRLTDVDGNEYVDYALAYGPFLLGHSPAPVIEAARTQLETLIGHGGSNRVDAELAEAICRTVPSAERCVFSSTGSEAVHAAIRIARAATGRPKVVKFLGHYHGWLDPIHVGTPGQLEPAPGTAGQDPLAAAATIVCAWNDLDALDAALSEDVAAVIMEPVAMNGGGVVPSPGYLESVRELTRRRGAVLIFDEVITGFRVALGGAQERYGVVPDLTILGKALGAGFPISSVCGSAAVMEVVSSRTVAHVGTFNANPICASAALAAVSELERRADEVYPHLEAMGSALERALVQEGEAAGVPLSVNRVGGAAYATAGGGDVSTYEGVQSSDFATYARFAEGLLVEGVNVPPRGLLYVSTEHRDADLERTREAIGRALAAIAA
ncbi:MAG TPA: aminotransferase class III-fold pyridoxal phosphate-dependent enzyme [Actinomycetota bacterium]